MSERDCKDMCRSDLEDEVMVLRAQVQALHNVVHVEKTLRQATDAKCAELKIQCSTARRELNVVAEKARDLESKLGLLEAARTFWQGEAKYWKDAARAG